MEEISASSPVEARRFVGTFLVTVMLASLARGEEFIEIAVPLEDGRFYAGHSVRVT